ncbi:hypothetical protein [uncultured Treponema sp.]|uniref:hypothetical protein n=1 Tax=uncultured Treponema sp. TaxID=162155 RepID=UPI00262D382F|nr:hypothetical protein [uncultured Treponema sp.]
MICTGVGAAVGTCITSSALTAVATGATSFMYVEVVTTAAATGALIGAGVGAAVGGAVVGGLAGTGNLPG